MPLRKYQQEAVDALRKALVNPKSKPIAILPTASGKSHILASIAQHAANKNKKVLILAHRQELIEQNAEKVKNLGLDVGIFCAGLNEKDSSKLITVGSIQTVYYSLGSLEPDLIIQDESHRTSNADSGMYRKLFEYYSDARVIGLTATPFRLSGSRNNSIVGENKFFNEVAYCAQIQDLIKQGFLCPLVTKYNEKEQADLSKVGKVSGDYKLSEAAVAMTSIQDKILNSIKSACRVRKSIIVFCCDVAHARSIAWDLQLAGIKSASVVGDDDKKHREESIAAFKNGELQVLTGCDIFVEGFDVPRIDCVMLCRPTQSVARYVQQVGRGMRLHDGKKDCLVLDHAGNIERHGALNMLVLDKDKGNYKYKKKPYKVCQRCQVINSLSNIKCKECGYQFPTIDRNSSVSKLKEFSSSKALIEEYPVHRANILKLTIYKKKSTSADNWGVDMLVFRYDIMRRGMGDEVFEYFCLEHNGFAKEVAFSKFYKRFKYAPTDSSDAIEYLAKKPDLLGKNNSLILNYTKNNKFPDIKLVINSKHSNPSIEVRNVGLGF